MTTLIRAHSREKEAIVRQSCHSHGTTAPRSRREEKRAALRHGETRRGEAERGNNGGVRSSNGLASGMYSSPQAKLALITTISPPHNCQAWERKYRSQIRNRTAPQCLLHLSNTSDWTLGIYANRSTQKP